MQDPTVDETIIPANQRFCVSLLQYLQIDRQSTGDQFPKLKQSIAWLGTKMKKKKFTHVCKKMHTSMRPIITRLKQGGDETLLTYAETNRVELFELMCLRQTYPGKLEEEKQKVWFTLSELAHIIGHANINTSGVLAPIIRRAAALAEPVPNNANPKDQVGKLMLSMMTDSDFTKDLKESLTSLMADENRSSVVMDMMENSGIVNYEQRVRAEERIQTKQKQEDNVTVHTSDGAHQEDMDEMNEIVKTMRSNQKKISNIDELTASFGANDQTFEDETASSGPKRQIGDVLAETMARVPEKKVEDLVPLLDFLSNNTEKDLQTKQQLSTAAQMLVTGDYKALMQNMSSIVSQLKGRSEEEPQEAIPLVDFGADIKLESLFQNLGSFTETNSFDA